MARMILQDVEAKANEDVRRQLEAKTCSYIRGEGTVERLVLEIGEDGPHGGKRLEVVIDQKDAVSLATYILSQLGGESP